MNVERVTTVLRVNGEDHEVRFAPHKTLLEVLREDMVLTGTKHGCELGECGTCTVLLDGEPMLSCLTLAVDCEGIEITTIEGLAKGADPHPLQKRFAELGASQCGYCSSGMLLTAKSVLEQNPAPDRATLKEELSGNLCRCTGYLQIFDAIEQAAKDLQS